MVTEVNWQRLRRKNPNAYHSFKHVMEVALTHGLERELVREDWYLYINGEGVLVAESRFDERDTVYWRFGSWTLAPEIDPTDDWWSDEEEEDDAEV